MKHATFEILNSTFSKPRISSYRTVGDNAEIVLAKYHTNIMLSEAMNPTLHYLKICLRNRIDHILKQYCSTNWGSNNDQSKN